MFCPSCGQQIPDNSVTCGFCHAAIPQLAQPMAPPPAAPQFAAPVPGYPQPAPTEKCGKATGSLVLGIIALVLTVSIIGFPLGFLLAVVGVILGHMAHSQIKQSRGRLGGHGKATAGLVMSYLSVAAIVPMLIIAAIAIPNLLHARMAANEAAAEGRVRSIETALVQYQMNCNALPDNLADMGPASTSSCQEGHNLLDDRGASTGPESGYVVTYTKTSDQEYAVTAEPVKAGNTGRRYFYSNQDNVIRWEEMRPADANSPPID